MFRAIHTSRVFIGGYEFRATIDGANVRLQSRHHSKSAWTTEAQITRAEFDDEAMSGRFTAPTAATAPHTSTE